MSDEKTAPEPLNISHARISRQSKPAITTNAELESRAASLRESGARAANVLEETWVANGDGELIYLEGQLDLPDAEIAEARGALNGDQTYRERGPLIAAAPELYRALKAVEWNGRSPHDETLAECPECMADEGEPHGPDCKLDAALRKARGER